MEPNTPAKENKYDEVSLKEVILSIRDWLLYFRSKWLLITLSILIGIVLGAGYYLLSPKQYVAKSTFVLNDPNQNMNMGSLSSLTSALGVNSNTGSSILMSPTNIVWLYSSNRMIGEALLTVVDTNGQKISLINWLINVDGQLKDFESKVREKYPKYSGFPNKLLSRSALSIGQNSLLNYAINLLNTNYLNVSNEDNAMGVIDVTFSSKNELFSYYFTKEIVRRVNDFYINTMTKKEQEQVTVLQQKVDEFNKNINQSMYQAAASTDAVPYANPVLQTLRIKPQRSIVDLQVNSAIYTAMVQQLEAAKVTLAQETPVIQIIDTPVLPLSIGNKSMSFCLLVGLFLGIFFISIFLVFKRIYSKAMQ